MTKQLVFSKDNRTFTKFNIPDNEFLNIDVYRKYMFCVDPYIIGIRKDNFQVNVKIFYKQNNKWKSSAINNANFMEEVWLSLFHNEYLGRCWLEYQKDMYRNSWWDIKDIAIELDKLYSLLYNYPEDKLIKHLNEHTKEN